MTEDVEVIKKELYGYVVAAVKEGLNIVANLSRENEYIGHYYKWPDMSLYDSGFPRFSECHIGEGPIKYREVFGSSSSRVNVNELKSFLELWDFVKGQTPIKNQILPPNMLNKSNEDENIKENLNIFRYTVFAIPEDLIDRYIHSYNSFNFETNQFDPIYDEYVAGIFSDKLYIDICVPILFLKFNFTSERFNDSLKIEKMEDTFQLARAPIQAYGPSVHKSVLSCATHMLVLENWYIPNENYWQRLNVISNVAAYPLEHVNNFFAALRIATGSSTGYAQLLMRPKWWADRYKAHLPPLYGTSIRAYPNEFENYFWNLKDFPEISLDVCKEVGFLYSELLKNTDNSIRVAIKRLNYCFLREHEEDSIIDATVGLESLLSDDNRNEMTHKLAMRIGALSKLSGNQGKKPYDIFREVKKIYDYRSAIIHGSAETHKKKEIKIKEDQSIPAHNLAIEYLRQMLRILITEPEYRDVKMIDKKLLNQ